MGNLAKQNWQTNEAQILISNQGFLKNLPDEFSEAIAFLVRPSSNTVTTQVDFVTNIFVFDRLALCGQQTNVHFCEKPWTVCIKSTEKSCCQVFMPIWKNYTMQNPTQGSRLTIYAHEDKILLPEEL